MPAYCLRRGLIFTFPFLAASRRTPTIFSLVHFIEAPKWLCLQLLSTPAALTAIVHRPNCFVAALSRLGRRARMLSYLIGPFLLSANSSAITLSFVHRRGLSATGMPAARLA